MQSEEHAERSCELIVAVKWIRNRHVCNSRVAHIVGRSYVNAGFHKRCLSTTLQIFQPVRKTVLLHRSKFYYLFPFILCFFWSISCKSYLSWQKLSSCYSKCQSEQLNSVLFWEDWLQNCQHDRGFGPVSLPCFRGSLWDRGRQKRHSHRGQGQGNLATLASEIQAWLYHLQGDFSKGKNLLQSSREICCYFYYYYYYF